MAEHLGQLKPPVLDGFNSFGKIVPYSRRQKGVEHCREMGLDTERSFSCVEAMCEPIFRDEPYVAINAGMRYLDLIGTYRLLAVLLTA